MELWIEARTETYRQVRCSESSVPEYSATFTVTGPGDTEIEQSFALTGGLDRRMGRHSADHCVLHQPRGAHVQVPPLHAPGHYRFAVASEELELSSPVRTLVVVEELVPR